MFKHWFSSSPSPYDRIGRGPSSVRGATGLSRAALAAMVERDGLFGRDSSFGAYEQRAILAQLGRESLWRCADARRGLSTVPATPQRLQVLKWFTECALSGGGTVARSEWIVATGAGLSAAERSEVLAVVGLLHESLGLMRPLDGGGARIATVDVAVIPALSNAA